MPDVARRQDGLFTASQAVKAGASPAQVRRRRASGAWVTVGGDALGLSSLPVDPWTRARAGLLTWPDAVVCLTSAALLHQLPVPDDGRTHLIVPHHRHHRASLMTHRLPLPDDDVIERRGVRVTALDRTLADCIGRLPADASEALATWAITRGRLRRDSLQHLLDTRPGAWGNRRRRQVLADTADGALSAAERRMHGLLNGAGIGGWAADHQVRDGAGLIGRVDVLFAGERLVIEVDGFAHHGRSRFQPDRTRQNRLVGAGYTVLRFTWTDLTAHQELVVAQISATLAMLRRRR